MKKLCIILSAILIFLGCSSDYIREETPKKALKKLSIRSYPYFTDDLDYKDIKKSAENSISYLEKIEPDREFIFGKDTYTAQHLIKSLKYFIYFIETNPAAKSLDNFIKHNYKVYKDVSKNILYTGYYEPILYGSLTKTDVYEYPIYAIPDDLIYIDLSKFSKEYKGKKIIARIADNDVVPYYTRKEIDYENTIDGKAKVLVWVKDSISLFFLHIQGSGRVILDNGEELLINYHGINGREYKSIGKLLIETGKISTEDMSMQKIRSYLNEHPEETEKVFSYNPSYVFFNIEKEGPLGCINVPLTPGRSIATDKNLFPQAALAFVKTKKPKLNENKQIEEWIDMTRFVQNQDTGGAIKGTGRVDFFWGSGDYAEIAAGHMKHPGELYFLVLNPDL